MKIIIVILDDNAAADLWLLNSCTVKNPAEDHFRNEVTKGRKAGKHVVVAGCVPQGQPRADYVQVSYSKHFHLALHHLVTVYC